MRGVTLLETIFSIFLLIAVVFMIANLYPTSLLAVRQGEQRLQAGTVAQSILEGERSRPFSELAPGVQPLAETRVGAMTYRPQLEVFLVPETDPEIVKGLRATVSWEHRGKTRSITREVLIYHLPR